MREHGVLLRRHAQPIWSKALPESQHEVADALAFERYGEDFDGRTGTGGVELWIPIKATGRR